MGFFVVLYTKIYLPPIGTEQKKHQLHMGQLLLHNSFCELIDNNAIPLYEQSKIFIEQLNSLVDTRELLQGHNLSPLASFIGFYDTLHQDIYFKAKQLTADYEKLLFKLKKLEVHIRKAYPTKSLLPVSRKLPHSYQRIPDLNAIFLLLCELYPHLCVSRFQFCSFETLASQFKSINQTVLASSSSNLLLLTEFPPECTDI
jgi:hypothetical protein